MSKNIILVITFCAYKMFTLPVFLSIMYLFRLNIKTSEEYDRPGTDPEDESQLMADFQNMKAYPVVFQPSRTRM
jgi:hypothetical protein